MSRLDEALRRSASSLGAPLPQSRQGDVFASPWSIGNESRGGNEPKVAEAAPPKASDSASPNSRLMISTAPTTLDANWKEWFSSPGVDPAVVEQFRKLAATLFHAQRAGRLKVLMVTSAAPGEGKTLTALNLARVLSESYRRSVLLIDADLRRPRLSEAAGLTTADGLSAALKSADHRKISVTRLTEHLALLPAGRPDPEPLSGLTSPRMQQLVEEGAERYDWVIVDTPPIGVATDAGLLSAMVDGTVLVVKAGETSLQAVRHAVETLGQDRIVGVVLNGVEGEAITPYEYVSQTSGTR
jgi:capsular exopolysaccharide synthesis family protein